MQQSRVRTFLKFEWCTCPRVKITSLSHTKREQRMFHFVCEFVLFSKLKTSGYSAISRAQVLVDCSFQRPNGRSSNVSRCLRLRTLVRCTHECECTTAVHPRQVKKPLADTNSVANLLRLRPSVVALCLFMFVLPAPCLRVSFAKLFELFYSFCFSSPVLCGGNLFSCPFLLVGHHHVVIVCVFVASVSFVFVCLVSLMLRTGCCLACCKAPSGTKWKSFLWTRK